MPTSKRPALAAPTDAGFLGQTEDPQSNPASIADQDNPLAAALAYADRGWPVFPVGADKKPRTAHGLKDGTLDRDQIRAWWRQMPDAGIGVVTGLASGLVVLDVDIDPAEGINGLDALEELGISTQPETPTAHTRRGGLHWFFARPGFEVRNSASKVGKHLDVRGDGGYIIVPPGPGRFWDPHLGLGTPLAPMPSWIVPKAPAEPIAQQPRKIAQRLNPYCEAALDGAVKAITGAMEGERRTTLNRECFSIGRLAGSGALPPAMALDVLTWAAARIPNFADHDPTKIVTTAFTEGLRQPREVPHGR